MKKNIVFTFSTIVIALDASIGCMDTSKHTNTNDGYDYKTLHYVACSCPCYKERHLNRKGKCFKCSHYVKQDSEEFDTSFLYEIPENPLFPPIMTFKYS